MCNRLGKCGQSSVTVAAVDRSIPTATIEGQAVINVNRQSLYITSNAFIARCDGSALSTGLSYSWIVSSNNVPQSRLLSVSKDFSVDQHSLSNHSDCDVLLDHRY